MKDIIRISWDSGYYALIPEKFFPTTMEKTRKVFKLMLADPSWGDAEIKELLHTSKSGEIERSNLRLRTEL